MNIKQAKQFIENIFSNLWENGDLGLLEKYYHQNVIGHCQDQEFGFEDIKNRLIYANERYLNRKYIHDEVVVLDEKFIVFKSRQIGIDKFNQSPYSVRLTGIYRIENQKVIELWLMPDEKLDYFAKGNEVTESYTVDDVEKNQFGEMMNDYRYFSKGKLIQLTDRETDCLYYFMNGLTAKEIARKLNISHRTIETHINNVKQKYSCSTKQDLRNKIFPSGPYV